jgi:hypothetical protein
MLMAAVSSRSSDQEGAERRSAKRQDDQSDTSYSMLSAGVPRTVAGPFHSKMSASPRSHEHRSHDEVMEQLERRQMWFNGLLTLFAGMGFGIAIWQGCQMRDSISLTERQLEATEGQLDAVQLDQRPWVMIHNTKIGTLTLGKRPECTSVMNNVGKTPAWLLFDGLEVKVIDTPPKGTAIDLAIFGGGRTFGDAKFDDVDLHLVPLPPGAHQSGSAADIPEMKEETLRGIENGDLTLVFFATAIYFDSTGALHVTDECGTYDHAHKEFYRYGQHCRMD